MTMKKPLLLVALLAAVLCAPFTASAQTAITTTTLTNAITQPQTGQQNIVINSATGVVAGSTFLYIDGSVYTVNAVSGTTITVTNTYKPATHNASVVVHVVPIAAQLGSDPVGSCIRSAAGKAPQYSPFTLMFNTQNGNIARCALTSVGVYNWRIVNPFCNVAGSCSGNPPQTQ
jgi:hypothetical protein